MKNLKKKPLGSGLLLAGLVLVLVVAIAALSWNGPADFEMQTEVAESTEPVQTATETAQEPAADILPYEILDVIDGRIQTPYGALDYPIGLSDLLVVAKTSVEPYTLEFCAVLEDGTEIHLFDISIGADSDGNMGLVETTQGTMPLNVIMYSLEKEEKWTNGEYLTLQAMQEAVNGLIDQMLPNSLDAESGNPEIADQPVGSNTVNNLEIETPYCTIYYPANWTDVVYCEEDTSEAGIYKVHFYAQLESEKCIRLFSFWFGGDTGDQVGAVMGQDGIPVPVNLIMEQMQTEGLDEVELEQIFAMQEASNQVIEKLPLLP